MFQRKEADLKRMIGAYKIMADKIGMRPFSDDLKKAKAEGNFKFGTGVTFDARTMHNFPFSSSFAQLKLLREECFVQHVCDTYLKASPLDSQISEIISANPACIGGGLVSSESTIYSQLYEEFVPCVMVFTVRPMLKCVRKISLLCTSQVGYSGHHASDGEGRSYVGMTNSRRYLLTIDPCETGGQYVVEVPALGSRIYHRDYEQFPALDIGLAINLVVDMQTDCEKSPLPPTKPVQVCWIQWEVFGQYRSPEYLV